MMMWPLLPILAHGSLGILDEVFLILAIGIFVVVLGFQVGGAMLGKSSSLGLRKPDVGNVDEPGNADQGPEGSHGPEARSRTRNARKDHYRLD